MKISCENWRKNLGKDKQKNKSEVEFLRGENRKLTAENRALKKQNRQYEKFERSQDEEQRYDSEDTYPNFELKILKTCTECGKGKYEELELPQGTYGTCNICNDRKKLK